MGVIEITQILKICIQHITFAQFIVTSDDAQETGASLLDVHTAKISIKIFQY